MEEEVHDFAMESNLIHEKEYGLIVFLNEMRSICWFGLKYPKEIERFLREKGTVPEFHK